MAFENSTCASLSDLRSKISTFLTTYCGYTAAGDVLYNSTDGIYAEVIHGATLIHSTYEGISLEMGTGQSGGTLTGGTGRVHQLRAGFFYNNDVITFPSTYYLFYDSASGTFICVLNFNNDYVQWLGWGNITKYGTWGGGRWGGASFGNWDVIGSTATKTQGVIYQEYYGAHPNGMAFWYATRGSTASTDANMILECDIDGVSGDWIDNSINNGTSTPYYPKFSGNVYGIKARYREYSEFNGKAHLHPIYCTVHREYSVAADAMVSIAGVLPAAKFVSLKNNNLGDIITFGTESWMVFPLLRKSGTKDSGSSYTSGLVLSSDNYESYNWGFAIKYDGP